MAQSIGDLVEGERPDFARAVSEYRANAIASDDRFTGFKEMICRNDGEAVAKAKRLVKDYRFGTATVSPFGEFTDPIELISDLMTSDRDLRK
jgi:predicted TIM-barrel fold metal-dependent hydrolase